MGTYRGRLLTERVPTFKLGNSDATLFKKIGFQYNFFQVLLFAQEVIGSQSIKLITN